MDVNKLVLGVISVIFVLVSSQVRKIIIYFQYNEINGL